MKKLVFILTCAVALSTGATLGLAQTTPTETPPVAAQQAQPQPAPALPATPPANETASTAETPAPSHSCRTRKQVGEACACRSTPDHVGAVEAATDGGRNMCVVRIAPPAQ